MATKKAAILNDAAMMPESVQDIIDGDTALAALRERLGVDSEIEATIHVYQIDEAERRDYKIWQGEASAYNLDTLAHDFGSGVYRIKAYARNAEGYKPLVYNIVQPWRLSLDDEARLTARREAAKHPPVQLTADKQTGADMREIVQSMMGGFRDTVAQLIAAKAETPDPFVLMERMAGMMKQMAPVQPAPGPDLNTLLTMMKTLKEITGAGSPEGASATELLLMKAADSLFPALAQGIQGRGAQPAPEPAANAALALAAPIAAPAGESNLTDEEKHLKIIDRLKIEAFALQLKMAAKAAARGVDATEYADTIYDAFDDEDLIALAQAPDWFATMCKAAPECAQHAAWFGTVRNALIDIAIEETILLRAPDGTLTTASETGKSEGIATGDTIGDSGTKPKPGA